jgi:nucleoside 2-deoxyribosyltransferase
MKNPIFQAKKCPLTRIEEPNLRVVTEGFYKDFGKKGYQWYYPHGIDFLMIVEDDLYYEQDFWDSNRTAIYFLVENGIWPNGKMVDKPMLEALISSSGIPVTPLEKMEELLSYLSKNHKHFGERFSLHRENYELIVRKLGLINPEELEGLIWESAKCGLLEIMTEHDNGVVLILSLKGWELAEKRDKGKQSKIVFVAMSFDEEMFKIYNEGIEPAIRESGFNAYIVSEQQIASDITINDAILVGIKKAKFTIADFTHHKAGVYFEAGYALGRGQKVIYTGKEDHIGTAHFDTRNYQHLVWKDGADLKKKLMDKIEVFIK